MLFHFHVRSCKKCTKTQIGKFANAKRCWTVMSAATAIQHRLYRRHSRWCVPCCDPAPRDFWHFCTVWLDWLAFSIKRRWRAGKRGGEERSEREEDMKGEGQVEMSRGAEEKEKRMHALRLHVLIVATPPCVPHPPWCSLTYLYRCWWIWPPGWVCPHPAECAL